jgi:hypothetical protein
MAASVTKEKVEMTTVPTIVGIDLGKNWFHIVGLMSEAPPCCGRK